MDVKLTLKLDESIILAAKRYAKSRNTSVSALVEHYLQSITSKSQKSEDISPIVKSISGVVSESKIDEVAEDYAKYLTNKYR
jgi:hypothetical protein